MGLRELRLDSDSFSAFKTGRNSRPIESEISSRTDIFHFNAIVTVRKFVVDSTQRPKMKIKSETSTIFLKNASGIKLKA